MTRRQLAVVPSLAAAAALLVGAAAASAAVVPKPGIFASPHGPVCLAASPTPERCNAKVTVASVEGKLQAFVGRMKTGCTSVDRMAVLQTAVAAPIRNGRFVSRRAPTAFAVGGNGPPVTLKGYATGEFTSPRVLEVTYRVQLVSGRPPGCRPSAFVEKTATIRWYVAKDNGG